MTIGGLPLHPLVVHAVVVLVPLTAIGAVLMALRPSFSRRFGVIVSILGGIAFVASVVAKFSGEDLARQVGVLARHAQLGDRFPLVALLLFALVLGLWLIDRGIPGNRSRPFWVMGMAGVTVVVALAAVALVVLVGHSGAESVWGSLPA